MCKISTYSTLHNRHSYTTTTNTISTLPLPLSLSPIHREKEMATQADVVAAGITPDTVGRAFVAQFYQILHECPDRVCGFYNDQSTMSRPGPSGSMITVTTTVGIKELMLSLDTTNFKAEILTADTQASYMNGVTVLVTGILTGQDNLRKKFTESFFLAPQDSGFFVLNDTLRFIEEYSLPVMEPVEEQCEKSASAEPLVTDVPVVEETPEVVVSAREICIATTHAPVEEIVEATTEIVDQPKSTSVEEVVPQPPADNSNHVQSPVEVLTNGDVNAPKKSYASFLKNGEQSGSAILDRGPAKPVRRSIAPKSAPLSGQQTQAPTVHEPAAPAKSAGNGSNGNATSNGHPGSIGTVAAPGHSIYIGHLPNDARPDLVEREFKRFGTIKKNGIQVRSNNGYTFGFVEFEDASAQQSALKMGKIQIDGREVQIEEKKTAARADDYPSGRGRGGYRNDGYRRGNYSNGRGYPRNDFGKRNGEGPPRGNRDNANGNSYQNGGGRGGARQGAAPK